MPYLRGLDGCRLYALPTKSPVKAMERDLFIGVRFLPREVAQVTHSFDLTDDDLLILHELGIRW